MDNERSLTPVREAHVFNENALAAYLSKHLDENFFKMTVRQFEGGQSNPTFMIENSGKHFVVRKKPPGVLLKSAHAVEREYRIMTALADTKVPVPKTYHLCEDDSIIGSAFFVMACVEGRVLPEPGLDSIAQEDRRPLYENAIHVMVALHAVDYEAVGLSDFGRPGNYYARQISRWSRQYIASKTSEIEAMEALMEWLPANTPESEEVTIVHGDFRIGNLIVHPTKPEAAAVLDWELSTIGHPLADLALFAFYANQAHKSGDHPNIPTEEEILAAYCTHSGRDKIDNWNFYKIFNLFRSAGISQGVYKRGLDGNASSQYWKSAGKTVPAFAEKAWGLVEEG